MSDARPDEAAQAARSPIFIMGAMGSGTTLLRLMLDSHEHIAIPHETGFMRAYNAHRHIPFKHSGRGWAKRLGWSAEELDREMAAFYQKLFMRYVSAHGKRRWGEKSPLNVWHIDGMARLFPDAVFVGIVRHPGGSIGSNSTRFKETMRHYISHYRRWNREIVRQAAHHADRWVILRYEDLVLQPEPLMRELLEWLGEPWSEKVLQHHVVQGERGGRQVVEGRTHVADPIDVSRISKWTTLFTRKQRAQIARATKDLGEVFGYVADEPAPARPLVEGRMLADGADAGRWVEQYPGIDFATKGSVPKPERLYNPREMTLIELEERDRLRAAQPALAQDPLKLAAIGMVRRLPPPARGRVIDAARAVRGRKRKRKGRGGRTSTAPKGAASS